MPTRKTKKPHYEVGYGKPPKHSQFKSGTSGNPKGRRLGQRNVKTVLQEVLTKRIPIREGDKARTVSTLEALMQVAVNKALKGDTKSFSAVVQLAKATGLMNEDPAMLQQEAISVDHDHAIIAEFLGRYGSEPQTGTATVDQKDNKRSKKTTPSETL